MGSRLLEEKEMRFLTSLPLPVEAVLQSWRWLKRQSGSKVLECGLLGMANRRLWKVESSQGYGASESHM